MTSNPQNQSIILAVDDNPRNLQLISALLSESGYKVVVVNNGENALKYLLLKKPDLILLDVMMPGMSGYEVMEKIQAEPEWREIPVIFLTAKSETSDIVQGFRLGAVDYIVKPFRGEEVQARIRTHLELVANRKKLQIQNKELNRLYAELEQKNKTISEDAERLMTLNAEKDRFFSIIAHDLRAPLSGFLSATELLEKNLDNFSKEEIALFISTMTESARQLNKMLENLLNWAQIQQGTLKPHPEVFDIGKLIGSAISSHQAIADKKNISVLNQVAEGVMVFADYQMVHTVLRNLLSNAIKFTPKGGTIQLRNVSTSDQHSVTIEVQDNGIGMNEETLKKLFRIDAKISRPGTEGETSTGLGLILCHDLVQRNNGTISVTSEEGRGTTFAVTLPKG